MCDFVFPNAAGEAQVICCRCHSPRTVSLSLTQHRYDIYSEVELQQFVYPTVGCIWKAHTLGLRCNLSPDTTLCPCCSNSTYRWINVPIPNMMPLLICIKRNRPNVEQVKFVEGKLPIPLSFVVNGHMYKYRGWSARMGHIQMIPFLSTYMPGKHLRYSWVPGGHVQQLSEQNHRFPKDPRHVDLLVYCHHSSCHHVDS